MTDKAPSRVVECVDDDNNFNSNPPYRKVVEYHPEPTAAKSTQLIHIQSYPLLDAYFE